MEPDRTGTERRSERGPPNKLPSGSQEMEENDASPALAALSPFFVQDRIGGEKGGGRWVVVTTGEL
jgi:hypothetical protein